MAGAGLVPGQTMEPTGTRIGKPFPGVEIRLVNDAAEILPQGEIGNISVRSGMVCSGYRWGDDGNALRSLDGWYTVGDQGFLHGDELHVLGRGADMIVTAVRNVYPHEVELALASVPGVSAAVVAGVPDAVRGQTVGAAILTSHAGVTRTLMRMGLEGALPQYKMPLRYFELDELPLTDRGKPSRQLLLEWISRKDPRVRSLG